MNDALYASLLVLMDRAQSEYPRDPAARDRWFWHAAGALLAGHGSRPGPYPDDLTEPLPRAAA